MEPLGCTHCHPRAASPRTAGQVLPTVQTKETKKRAAGPLLAEQLSEIATDKMS